MTKRHGQGRAPRAGGRRGHVVEVAVAVSVVLSGCSPDSGVPAQMQRPTYTSQEACLKDWADPDCAPAAGGGGGSGGSGGTGGPSGAHSYVGPWISNGYYYHPDGSAEPVTRAPTAASGTVMSTPPPHVAAAAASHDGVSRGGFGESAAAHSSSGG